MTENVPDSCRAKVIELHNPASNPECVFRPAPGESVILDGTMLATVLDAARAAYQRAEEAPEYEEYRTAMDDLGSILTPFWVAKR